ncbi:MAG: ORF6N domain-containing protein [Flavobacteriales bacterium]|jgi:phage regulator Rha-like protein|nr:ORF6N domain-containing protein [Flavobacteriales bacterium]
MNTLHATLVLEPSAKYVVATPPDAVITGRIHLIRAQRVLLDRDLAELYGVETKQLKRQVRRNLGRFPEDFMFELTDEENEALRSQIGTLKQGEHSKYLPMAFTEQGVAMLSSVLNSEQAILVNIHIIRVFTRMREMLLAHHEVLQKLEELEGRLSTHDEEIQAIFDHLTALVSPAERQGRPIGFKPTGQ